MVASASQVFSMLMKDSSLVSKINENTKRFRDGMTSAGFTISGEDHPICPVMIGDAALATQMADDMLGKDRFWYVEKREHKGPKQLKIILNL